MTTVELSAMSRDAGHAAGCAPADSVSSLDAATPHQAVVLDGLSAHVCLLDEAGRIVYVNRAWRAFAEANGGRHDTVGAGVSYLDVCAGATGAGAVEAGVFAHLLLEVLAGKRDEVELEYPCHGPDEQRWFVATARRVAGVSPTRVVVWHQPVTNRKVLERRIQDSRRLESLGTLAGGVAHDFNNILAAILGNASMVLNDLPANSEARSRMVLIERAAQRGRDLVRRVLTFSGKKAQDAKPVPLLSLVQESVALLRTTQPAGVSMELVCDAPDIWVRADSSEIQQVLINLCTNAWHAIVGRPGRVEIRLALVSLDDGAAEQMELPQPGPYAQLSVADDGCGMEDAVRERIFEPFYTTRLPGEGTGLGLSLALATVQRHGGRLCVSTSVGKGSRFDVFLPICRAEPVCVKPTPVSASRRPPAGGQILLVDDDDVVGLTMEAILRRAGYLVRRESNANCAMQAIVKQADDISLLVTDYSMPEMSGLDLCTAARRVRPTLPCLIVSGYITDELRRQAHTAGVAAVLQKSDIMECLPTVLADIASGRPPHVTDGPDSWFMPEVPAADIPTTLARGGA